MRVSPTTTGDRLNKAATDTCGRPDANETHALVAGLTCGRPSNPDDEIGDDECHAEAAYAIVDKGINENRNHATKISGNDGSLPLPERRQRRLQQLLPHRQHRWRGSWLRRQRQPRLQDRSRRRYVRSGSGDGSYAPIAGCTSCHDQTDAANTVAGNFTFPHGQTPTGVTNVHGRSTVPPATDGPCPHLVRLGWLHVGDTDQLHEQRSNQKAYDGQCLKCHRDGAGDGIGLTK